MFFVLLKRFYSDPIAAHAEPFGAVWGSDRDDIRSEMGIDERKKTQIRENSTETFDKCEMICYILGNKTGSTSECFVI